MFKFNNTTLPENIECYEFNTDTLLPKTKIDSINIHKRYGTFVLSKQIGERIFKAKVKIKGATKQDIYDSYRELSQLLYTEQPEKLELTYDTDIYYLAMVENTNLEEISPNLSVVEITFYCSNPFSYNSTAQTAEELTVGAITTITNDGDFESKPVFEIEVINDSTFLELANKTTDETLLIGAEVVFGEGSTPAYNKFVEIDYDAGQCSDLTEWTNDSSNFDYGSPISDFKLTTTQINGYNQVGLEPTSYGSTIGSWVGSHAYHTLSEQLDNFSITFDVQMETSINATGACECYLWNALGNRLAKLTLQNMGGQNPVLYYKIYDGSSALSSSPILHSASTNNYGLDVVKNRPKSYYYSPENITRIRISKRSQNWNIYIAKFKSNDDSFSQVVSEDLFSFIDKSNILIGANNYLDKVSITASKYSTSQSPSKLIIHSVKIIEELATQNGIPYILHNGDKIIISSGDALVIRNGEPYFQYFDPASDFLTLAKGDNDIFVNGSAGSLTNVFITKNERFL
jgi:predicted phage tail component-like protein